MIGKVTAIQDDRKAVFVQFDEPAKFKADETVNVSSKKKIRTSPQNRLYWAFLSWCIHKNGGDLISQGHFSTDALHSDIKSWFKEAHQHDFNIDRHFTTTELNTKEFSNFFEIVEKELMISFFGIDTSGFYRSYAKFDRWSEYNDPNFKEFMDEAVPETPF